MKVNMTDGTDGTKTLFCPDKLNLLQVDGTRLNPLISMVLRNLSHLSPLSDTFFTRYIFTHKGALYPVRISLLYIILYLIGQIGQTGQTQWYQLFWLSRTCPIWPILEETQNDHMHQIKGRI